jgi:hypothetical protein
MTFVVWGPVGTIFEGSDVMSIIRIGIEDDVDEVMNAFVVGSLVKVKCRMGFMAEDHVLLLICEEVDMISRVDVVVA